MGKKVKNNKIFTDELKRTFPIYTLGVIFHIMVIYILYKIPVIIGNILDLLIQGNVSKEIVMKEVYSLIFYSVVMMFPRIMYRTLYFMVARKSDTILRKKVLEHLQYVKPEYYDKEEKGAFLAYLSKELLLIRKFIGNIFFYSTRMIISPIIGLIIIGKNFNLILVISKNLKNVVINKTMTKILRDIREKVFSKVLNFKMATFNKYNSAELYTRLTVDIDNLLTMFSGILDILLNNITHIVFMVIMMFIANINIAIIGAFTIFIIAIVAYNSSRILGRLDNELLKKRDVENREFSELYNKNKLTYLF